MKILAKAIPNKDYINIRNLFDVVLEARLENNQVSFFETHTKNPDWIVQLKEETIFDLFDENERTKRDIPFLVNENKNFAIVLYRKENKEKYLTLKQNTPNE